MPLRSVYPPSPKEVNLYYNMRKGFADYPTLEQHRQRLLQQLSGLQEIRRGSLPGQFLTVKRRDGSRVKRESSHELLLLGVLRFSLFEDGDVGVSVSREGEEILVGSLCLDFISQRGERPAQLQARQRAEA